MARHERLQLEVGVTPMIRQWQPGPEQSRSTVLSTKGLVCSPSPQAASAGIRVLAEGGNAFDAAIAIAAVETVTLASMCGIGGEVFTIAYQASTGKMFGLTSSGPAPKTSTPDLYRSMGYREVPFGGPLSASPPGEVAAYQLIADTFGTRPLAKLLEPAIGYADEGFPLPQRLGTAFANGAERLAEYPSTAATFLKKDGKPYGPGNVFVNKNLARTLRRIGDGGADEFYRGGLARDIAKAFADAGGLIDEDAMADVEAELYEPLTTTYRGYLVAENRPPSQGTILLEMLNILEGYDLASMGHLSPESIHLMIEAKKLAFADRNRHLADPRFADSRKHKKSVPVEVLASKDHAAHRRRLIDPDRASGRVEAADLVPMGTDTSYFCVADSEGNTVSFIHSIYASWGSAFVAGDTGIVFNNRQRGFRLEDGHVNTMAPGKRPMHTLNSYTLFKDGRPFIVGGTPGADFQVQGNTQMITGIVDYGIPLQTLVDGPRWVSTPGSEPKTAGDPFEVGLEPWMPEEVAVGLRARGHDVTVRENGAGFGIVQLIKVDQESGVLEGASDPRADGQTAAL
jgi:gamma-glutamyltranspeptidase/glutathione hydrolase